MGQSAQPDFDTFEIWQIGTTTISPDASPISWITIPHNLGFAPIPFTFLNDITHTIGSTTLTTDGIATLPTYTGLTIDTTNHQVKFSTWLEAIADDKNIYFIFSNSTGSPVGTLPLKYLLLREKAN